MMRRAVLLVAPLFAVGAACAEASALNPLGVYIGGAVGHTDVRSTLRTEVPTYEFKESDIGWKILVGLRPIKIFAAEVEYVDFGHPRSTSNVGFYNSYSSALQRAASLSGLFYVPIPLPLLDVYVRGGVARLESSGANRLDCNPLGPCPLIIVPPTTTRRTDIDLLYGAGLQVRLLSALAARLEYERINAHAGDPDMISVGLTWTF